MTDIENIIGSNQFDDIQGDKFANVLRGLGSDDFLQGGDGADVLDGGAGNDRAFPPAKRTI